MVAAMFQTSFGMSDNFKTAATYGWQPLLGTELVKAIIAWYLENVRQLIQDVYPELAGPDSPLFPSLRLRGGFANIASHLQAFFMRTCGTNNRLSYPCYSNAAIACRVGYELDATSRSHEHGSPCAIPGWSHHLRPERYTLTYD